MALEELSPRERSVLEVAATGASTKDIAARLVLSPRTIESHLASIYRKLGVSSRPELVARLHQESDASPPAPTPIGQAAGAGPIGVADVFVGRSEELELIAQAVTDAGADRQRVVLIGGEPGAGKSTLVTYAAAIAGAAGSIVLVGGCDESLNAPFQPIADALGSYVATSTGPLADITGPRGGALSALLPDLADRLPPLAGTLEGPAGLKMIVEATFDTLVNAGTHAPVVLILEDLHWGDHATLEWLRMLAGTTRDIPLVVLATFRDTDLTQSHPLPVLLADLWRERDIRRVNLGGLNAHEVAVLAKQVIGTDVDNDLVERLHAQMGGNPFFTVQMLREMAQTSRSVDNLLPLPILEVIRQRVHKLGDAVATALQVGAVLGEQIDVNLLEHSLQRVLPQAPPTLDLLDTAVAAGLVIESRGPPGQFHFAHDLIRQAILNDIGTTRQARMHGVLAATMEELNLEDPSIPVRVIAEHFSQGASAKDRLRGGALTVIAAHEVPTRLSPDDVVDLAERTMATLPDGAAGDRLRLELLSLIADAQFARFDNTAHRQAVIDAVEVAMRLDDAVADKAPLDSTFAEGAPADPGGVDHPHEDSGREVSERPRGKTGRHGKWKNIVAVSIATVSVLGAITSWRIETHATAASGFEQSAVAATITNTRLNVESRVEAQQFYDEFLRYERLSDEATQLAPAGCPDNHVSVLDYNAQVVCQMKQSIFNGGNDGYVNSNHRTYDISALTRDLVAQNGFELDNQPKPYQDLAAVERHSEDRLLLLTLLLVLSLALLTVAHLARRRKVLLATATPAWVLMVIGAALLVAWEL